MIEVQERLRQFINTGAEPVSSEEIFSRARPENTGKDLRLRLPRTRRRVLVRVGATMLIAAVVSVVLLVVPSVQKSDVPKASAATVLKAAAAVARDQPPIIPGPGQYLYVAVLNSATDGSTLPPSPHMFWYFTDDLVQTWTSPRATGSQQWKTVGRPQFLTNRDRQIWLVDGSNPLESGSEAGDFAPYYNVVDLPTKASAMKAYFATQPYLESSPLEGRDASFQFNSALEFLQNGASSIQRAALLKYVASLPGISLQGDATSIATREEGAVIAMKTDRLGLTEEAIINTATSSLVEIRFVVNNPTEFRSSLAPHPQPTYARGEILTYTDYLGEGIVALGKLPAHPPQIPQIWPSHATRLPLPGSVTK